MSSIPLDRSHIATFALGVITGYALVCAMSDSRISGPSAGLDGPFNYVEKTGNPGGAMRVHHGAVDRTMITSEAPQLVMARVRAVLDSFGVDVKEESDFRLRCIRLKRIDDIQVVVDGNVSSSKKAAVDAGTIYGDPAQDIGDEVRFRVELTRIDQGGDTYSLDIRRLKGDLQSYTYLYGTIRKRVALS